MRHMLIPLPCTAQELESVLHSYCDRNGAWDANVGWQYDALRQSASLVLYRHTSRAMGRESINKQCYECANCQEPAAGWDGSKFRCAFLSKDFGTWHYDVPNECPCKGDGWIPKKKEGAAK